MRGALFGKVAQKEKDCNLKIPGIRPLQFKTAEKLFSKRLSLTGNLARAFKNFDATVLNRRNFHKDTRFPFHILNSTTLEDRGVQNDMKGKLLMKSMVLIIPPLNMSRMEMWFMYLPT